MGSMDINEKLQQTLSLLKELGNHLSDLVNASPDVFKDELLDRQLQDFRKEYQESIKRLTNPSLVIATLGTTSSGKSTIVNALMGRRLAPIEAGEMSGGVLRIIHSDQRKLVIEKTPDAAWETGTWENLGDGELYERVQSTMHRYHDARKKKDFIAPQIQVQAPLLPACDLSLSGLPQGIGVEFLDLPGLKSVQDRANLAVIQPQVGKAFSLVALDYMQVDEQHRQKLLGELKDVVKFLQGRTESMIFILNRVDARGSDDFPLEVRLSKLKEEIRDTLELPSLPDVIPFSARLLYYAQCAWGTNNLSGSTSVPIETRTRLLQALFKDCGSIIQEKRGGDRDLRDWLQRIGNDLEDGYEVDDETLRKIVRYALDWSGGTALWQCINHRINESFTDLVILPALNKVFSRFDSLSESLDVVIQNRALVS